MEHRNTRARGIITHLMGVAVALLLLGGVALAFDGWLRSEARAEPRTPAAAFELPRWPLRPAAPPQPSQEELERRAFAEGLQRLLEAESAAINGYVSVHVRLPDGTEAGIDPDRPVAAASLIKVPVLAALYDSWEDGELKRTPADERRARLMITRSSNTLTNVLIKQLGMQRINRWLQDNGYQHTCLRSLILAEEPYGPSEVTAREMTAMLEAIRRRELVNPSASQEMRQLLLAQRWRERVPAGIPPKDARVGNKTGTMQGLLHDAAFVEPKDGPPYTMAVLIERENRAAVRSEAIAGLSRAVFHYVTQRWPGRTATGAIGLRVSSGQPGSSL